MPYSIALAGKGGTGKTTIAGFLVAYLVGKGKVPVLAVDADANSNFNEVLGVEVDSTLGEAREEMKKGVAPGMTKDVYMEMKLQEAVIEADGFDLVVMGRPEGSGCYCAANSLLTMYLEKLIGNYPYMVTDNEAGMEHISRLVTNNVDLLLVVSDPTKRGLQAASRIIELTKELNLSISSTAVIINQVKEEHLDAVTRLAEAFNLPVEGFIPEDQAVVECDLSGKPTASLGRESKAVDEIFKVFDRILTGL
jgi:CO dehydrogenase maturation factor